MAEPLSRIWFGMETVFDPFDDAGASTDSTIVLQVTRNDAVDILNYAFPDTPQADQEETAANLYFVKLLPPTIVPEEILAIRVGITGDDKWLPQNLIVWGERAGAEPIVPLGITLFPKVTLSTDTSEGVLSFTIRPVRLGGVNRTIHSLAIMMTTADRDSAGTDNRLNLKITDAAGTLFVDYTFGAGDPEYNHPQRGGANLYWTGELASPFSKGRLNAASIQLTIEGDDAWIPTSFSVFGLPNLMPAEESEVGRPTVLVPLVHLTEWNLGTMSTDPSEGVPIVTLPLVS